jgi:hypothetical protein
MHHLCVWTRMQAEAGQPLEEIVARKERERQRGDGLFFWGVGNAPSRKLPEVVAQCMPVDVVFSVMRSAPKKEDANPSGVVRWRTYLDHHGNLCEIPEHTVVTSKAMTAKGPKTKHYALICRSDAPLHLTEGPPFDPEAFRNLNLAQSRIGFTQVTALVQRVAPDGSTPYRVNLRAQLVGSYWVRLSDPEPTAP